MAQVPGRRCWAVEGAGSYGVGLAVLLPAQGERVVEVGRLRSEAAFAALAGVSPISASSGQVTRHRLNRGGDRRLNRALHTVALVRLRDDPATRAYAARRRSEGKSPREIRRCIKRAIARQLFNLLQRYDHPDVEVVRVA